MVDGWQTVAALPSLEADELQVWKTNLAAVTESLDVYRRHLSSAEFDRAARFRSEEVRRQFVVARACLRVLLGNIVGMPPALIPITLSAYGKPETPAVNGRSLFFNVAHSRETILIALCSSGRVGVDLEYLDRETDVLEVARASFTAAEYRQIEETADSDELRRAFFQCWTRKEAVVKADGRGLSLALDSFEVPVLTAAQSAMVEVYGGTGESGPSATWFVSDLTLDDIVGAVAVPDPQLRVRTFGFPLARL